MCGGIYIYLKVMVYYVFWGIAYKICTKIFCFCFLLCVSTTVWYKTWAGDSISHATWSDKNTSHVKPNVWVMNFHQHGLPSLSLIYVYTHTYTYVRIYKKNATIHTYIFSSPIIFSPDVYCIIFEIHYLTFW